MLNDKVQTSVLKAQVFGLKKTECSAKNRGCEARLDSKRARKTQEMLRTNPRWAWMGLGVNHNRRSGYGEIGRRFLA